MGESFSIDCFATFKKFFNCNSAPLQDDPGMTTKLDAKGKVYSWEFHLTTLLKFQQMKVPVTMIRPVVLSLVFALLCSATLNAQIFFDGSPGTDAPPATLGGFTMVPFEEDNRPVGESVQFVTLPTPFTGNLGFTPDLLHRKISNGWATWSHGYSGSVYFTGSGNSSMTFTLPPGTHAFYFYAQPNMFGVFNIEALGEANSLSTVSSGPIPVDGQSGAKYFGFYTDGTAEIAQIVVTAVAGADGFAVGEFGIYVASEPVPVPLSNLAIYLGAVLMVSLLVFQSRRLL